MKQYFFIIFLIFLYQHLAAQTILWGSVKDENGKLLPHATITAENPADSTVIAFVILNTDGSYKLTVNSTLPKLLLRMRLINYATQFFLLDNKSKEQNFTTHPEAVMLKEVVVRPSIIRHYGDTISYNADSFAAKHDRTLADVLRKLPGVDVSENGQISVQGNPINKFYVEGKDLMGGRYGIVTNSLPNNDVSRIEVLNNHQPIKMLQGKIPSIQPAMNIRLKKAVTFTGRAALGTGLTPFLWTASATPMWFTKKQQALVTYKTNNTGDNIAGEMNEHFFVNGFEGKTVSNNTGNRLAVAGPSMPDIPLRRYLFNNVHSLSANVLTAIDKAWEIKLNINYVKDNQTKQGGNSSEIRTLNEDGYVKDVINYSRKSDIILQKEQLNARATLSRNVKNNFIKNVFAFRTDRNIDCGNMYFDDKPIQQRLYSPGFSLQNSFSALIPVNKKKSQNLNLKSFINYIKEKQNYNVRPAAMLQLSEQALKSALPLHQELFFRNFVIEKEASLAFRYKKLTWVPLISWEMQNNYLQSEMSAKDSSLQTINLPNDWRNNVHFTKNTTTASINTNFDNEIFRFSVTLPIRYYFISVKDEVLDFNKMLDRPAFEPNMFMNYQLHPFWDISTNTGISNSFSTIDNLYPAYIFSGLGFTAYRSEILQRKSQKAGVGIACKNTLNNIFGNINYNFYKTHNNIILSRTITANGLQTIDAVMMDNTSLSHTINAQIGKYLNKWRTNLQLNYNWSLANTNALLNNVLMPTNTTSHNARIKLSNNYFDWMSFEYNFSFLASKRYTVSITTPLQNSTHAMNAFFYPFENNTLSAAWDNVVYKFGGQRFENNFFDVTYQYNLPKRKMDFEIKLLNILNTQTYRQVIVSAIETSSIYYTIRPKQLLFSVKFNLR